MIALYWHIGKRTREDVLGNDRAESGRRILQTLSKKLTAEYGSGFTRSSLSRIIRFARRPEPEHLPQGRPPSKPVARHPHSKSLDLARVVLPAELGGERGGRVGFLSAILGQGDVQQVLVDALRAAIVPLRANEQPAVLAEHRD